MFFGQDLQERRRRLSHKAGELRDRRLSVARWRSRRPFVSTTGVDFRIAGAEKKFALAWMGEIFEVDGSYMLDAGILTDQRIGAGAIGGALAGGAGAIMGAVGAGAAPAFQPLQSVVVRLHLAVPQFEELDFTMWESPFSPRSRDVEASRRAFESAGEFVRLCLSVR